MSALTYEHADSGHELLVLPVLHTVIHHGDPSVGEPAVWAESHLTGALVNGHLLPRAAVLGIWKPAQVRSWEEAEAARDDLDTLMATVTRADERRDDREVAA